MFYISKELVVFIYCMVLVHCQDISWTWMNGPQDSNVLQSATHPGGRSGMAYWSFEDNSTVWMFGGEYHVEKSANKVKNDLWMFQSKDNSWKMLHNGTGASKSDVPLPRQLSAACGVSSSYFVIFGGLDSNEKVLGDTWIYYFSDKQWYTLHDLRKKLGASNETSGEEPAPRGDMVVWCTRENMIIFGGYDEKVGLRHDMWTFNLAKLSWQQSKISSALPADPDFVKHLDYPAGRSGSTSWVSGDKLFLLGGNILPNNPRSKHLMIGYSGDLWDFDLKDEVWTYHGGTRKTCTKPGVFGKLGIASKSNHPGCRRRAAAWVDSRNNLWMFGGDGIDDSVESVSVFRHTKLLSDLWFYDLDTDMWTWKGGEKSGEQKGKFDSLGDSSHDNLPGSRCEMVVWRNWNYLYLFGGVGHDVNGRDGYLSDIWKVDVHLDGSVFKNIPYPGPVFGIIILGCGLVVLMIVSYMFGRKRFQGKQEERKGKYQQIPIDPDV